VSIQTGSQLNHLAQTVENLHMPITDAGDDHVKTVRTQVDRRYEIGRHIPAVFAADEAVELIADPLATADYLALWDRVKTGFQAGMTYVARMVLIDSEQPEVQGRLVSEREFGWHRIDSTP
jgi:predicted ATPase